MNAKTLGEVLLRVWGVVLLASAVASLGSLSLLFEQTSGPDAAEWRTSALSSAAHLFMTLVIGLSLIRGGHALAARLFKDSSGPNEPIDLATITSLAFSLLGFYFLAVGLRDAIAIGVMLASKASWDETRAYEYFWDRQRQAFVAAIVNIAAGAVLLISRKHLASWWMKLRSSPAANKPPNESAEE